MTRPAPLAEALGRSRQALNDLDASILQASQCLAGFDDLKAQAVKVLGYDPTLPAAFSWKADLKGQGDVQTGHIGTAAPAVAQGLRAPAAPAAHVDTALSAQPLHGEESVEGSLRAPGMRAEIVCAEQQQQQQQGQVSQAHDAGVQAAARFQQNTGGSVDTLGAGHASGGSVPAAEGEAPRAGARATPPAEPVVQHEAAVGTAGRPKTNAASSSRVNLAPLQALWRQGATQAGCTGRVLEAGPPFAAAACGAQSGVPDGQQQQQPVQQQQQQEVPQQEEQLQQRPPQQQQEKQLQPPQHQTEQQHRHAAGWYSQPPQQMGTRTDLAASSAFEASAACAPGVQPAHPAAAAAAGGKGQVVEVVHISSDEEDLLPLAQRRRRLLEALQQQGQPPTKRANRQQQPGGQLPGEDVHRVRHEAVQADELMEGVEEEPRRAAAQAAGMQEQAQAQQQGQGPQPPSPRSPPASPGWQAPPPPERHPQQHGGEELPSRQQSEVVDLVSSASGSDSGEELPCLGSGSSGPGAGAGRRWDQRSGQPSPASQQQHAQQRQQTGPGWLGRGVLAGHGQVPPPSKWYAVVKGRRPGLYTTWTDCAGQVLGFRSGEYKTFSTEEAARQYLQQRGVDSAAFPAPQQQRQPEATQHAPLDAADGRQAATGSADVASDVGRRASDVGAASSGEDEAQGGEVGADSGSGSGSRGAFQFADPDAARQFPQNFSAAARPGRGAGAGGRGGRVAGAKRRRKAATSGSAKRAAKPSLVDKKEQQAWEAFAKVWREKNKPSEERIQEIKKEAAAAQRERDVQAQAAAAARQAASAAAASQGLKTPLDRLHAERAAGGGGRGAPAAEPAAAAPGEAGAPRRPPTTSGSPNADRRTFHRHACQAKVAGLTSFAQVLRAFKVPCDPLRLKEAYRTAVRMYHPDSNSKEKVWRTEEQREQAEEVMKVINERKPDSL